MATSSYNDLSPNDKIDADAWLSHYKQAQSRKMAIMSNPGYTEDTRRRSAADWETKKQYALDKLAQLGLTVDKIKNVYTLVPLA